MDQVVKILQPYQLHPVADHFSVALLFVAVLIDLVASMSPTRIWLRYTALTLMILGALAGNPDAPQFGFEEWWTPDFRVLTISRAIKYFITQRTWSEVEIRDLEIKVSKPAKGT